MLLLVKRIGNEESDDKKAAVNQQPEMDAPVPEAPPLSEAEMKKMGVDELKDELRKQKYQQTAIKKRSKD